MATRAARPFCTATSCRSCRSLRPPLWWALRRNQAFRPRWTSPTFYRRVHQAQGLALCHGAGPQLLPVGPDRDAPGSADGAALPHAGLRALCWRTALDSVRPHGDRRLGRAQGGQGHHYSLELTHHIASYLWAVLKRVRGQVFKEASKEIEGTGDFRTSTLAMSIHFWVFNYTNDNGVST